MGCEFSGSCQGAHGYKGFGITYLDDDDFISPVVFCLSPARDSDHRLGGGPWVLCCVLRIRIRGKIHRAGETCPQVTSCHPRAPGCVPSRQPDRSFGASGCDRRLKLDWMASDLGFFRNHFCLCGGVGVNQVAKCSTSRSTVISMLYQLWSFRRPPSRDVLSGQSRELAVL